MKSKKELAARFVYNLYKAGGKKVKLNAVRSVPEEELMKLINSDPELVELFEKFCEAENAPKVAPNAPREGVYTSAVNRIQYPSPEDAEPRLSEIIDNLVKEPFNFLYVSTFTDFMHILPYGYVSTEKLYKYCNELQKHNAPLATTLLDYIIKQELDSERKEQ